MVPSLVLNFFKSSLNWCNKLVQYSILIHWRFSIWIITRAFYNIITMALLTNRCTLAILDFNSLEKTHCLDSWLVSSILWIYVSSTVLKCRKISSKLQLKITEHSFGVVIPWLLWWVVSKHCIHLLKSVLIYRRSFEKEPFWPLLDENPCSCLDRVEL